MTAVPGTQIMLSNSILNSTKEDRDLERAARKANGNQHGKKKKSDVGRGFDAVMASVFIERKAPTKSGGIAPIYYCLGCDHDVRNSTRGRNSAHMVDCKVNIPAF